jgi:hypothetical protein
MQDATFETIDIDKLELVTGGAFSNAALGSEALTPVTQSGGGSDRNWPGQSSENR